MTDDCNEGTRKTMQYLAPLLVLPAHNPHATIISTYLTAITTTMRKGKGYLEMKEFLPGYTDTDERSAWARYYLEGKARAWFVDADAPFAK